MNHLLGRISALALAAAAPVARASEPAPPARSVRLIDSQPGRAGRWVAAAVQATRRATLATRLSAQVRSVRAEEGEAVRAGQLLVEIGDADLRGQLAAAEAARTTAVAHERRIRALAEQRAATPSELEMATAQRAQADAAVEGVRTNLQYADLRAPFAGTVQARRVEPGDLVGPGQPLLVLEGGGLELAASLSEAESRGLAIGGRLRFRVGEVAGEAVVTALTPGGDPVTHRRGLKARILGDPPIRSGAFARLEVGSEGDGGIWVPRSALVERGDLTGVFVAAGPRAELRWVSTGEPVGDRVPVRAGLAAGERVIDAPGALRDGEAIEVRP